MDILPELSRRRSPVLFKDEAIEEEKMDALIEAARWAPSCGNNQSWNYVFVHKNDSTRHRLEDALSRGNKWAKTASYLVAVGAEPGEACQTNGLPYYAYDVGLSVMSLVIEAEHQGFRVHQMAGYNEGKVKEALGFPKQHRVVVVFALGYEQDATELWDELDERMKTKLSRPRKRKPANENFYFSLFGQPTLS
jgi:nitroreductase